MSKTLRIAGFQCASRINGPGERVVLWVQGCSRGCPGCFNPSTHDPAGGEAYTVEAVVARILEARGPDTVGVTFSGGEPFEQADALVEVCDALEVAWPEVSLMAFTGFDYEAIQGAELLSRLDLLADGAYFPGHRQTILDLATGERTPLPDGAEIHLDPSGAVLVSGFPDEGLLSALRQL